MGLQRDGEKGGSFPPLLFSLRPIGYNLYVSRIPEIQGGCPGRDVKIVRIAILSVLVLAFAAASGLGCGGKPVPSVSTYYEVGKPAIASQEILTVASVSRATDYNTAGLSTIVYAKEYAPPTTVFIIFQVTVTNVGKQGFSISRNDFALKDSAGHEYKPIGYKGADGYPTKNLASGETEYGIIAFIVPDVVTGLELYGLIQGEPLIQGVWTLPY